MAPTNKRTCLTIILAAGEGTRMKSTLPKVLHPVAGLPMVCHVVKSALASGATSTAIVTGNGREKVEAEISNLDGQHRFFEQTQRLGTGHAVLAARDALQETFDDVLVLFGDTPLLKPDTLSSMREYLTAGADIAVLGFETDKPQGYGRLVMEGDKLKAIREDKDASESERAITFCNGGIMAINGAKCLTLLEAIGNDNAKGEYYLTDIVEIGDAQGLNVVAHRGDEREILGINTRVELAEAEAIWQGEKRNELLLAGVSMVAPDTVFFSHDTSIASDSLLEPNQFFGPGVTVSNAVHLKANGHYEACSIGEGSVIGPFARLRPGTELASKVKVGNFVEIKQAKIAAGAKVNHLSYIGDSNIGAEANIGAGTITCNYDGVNKHLTQIGSGAFIGSNSALVAPVNIGDGAYVGSGSVVTEDVPDNGLAIARARQVTLKERAKKILQDALALKAKRMQK